MPVGVVDPLEAIEVDHRKASRDPAPRQLAEPIDRDQTVRESRQRVRRGALLELVSATHVARDVDERQHDASQRRIVEAVDSHHLRFRSRPSLASSTSQNAVVPGEE